MAPIHQDGIEQLTSCFVKWWTAVFESQEIRATENHVSLTINILWQFWKAKNEREFNQKEKKNTSQNKRENTKRKGKI